MRRHAKKILQFLASKAMVKAHPTPLAPGEKKRRAPFLYRVVPDSKKTQRLMSVRGLHARRSAACTCTACARSILLNRQRPVFVMVLHRQPIVPSLARCFTL